MLIYGNSIRFNLRPCYNEPIYWVIKITANEMKNFSTWNIRSVCQTLYQTIITSLISYAPNSMGKILSRPLLDCVLRGNMIIVGDCVAELMKRHAAFEDFNRDTSIVVECRTATIECRLLTNLQVILTLNGSAYITLSFLFRSSQFGFT